jgi:hypothetical protein
MALFADKGINPGRKLINEKIQGLKPEEMEEPKDLTPQSDNHSA